MTKPKFKTVEKMKRSVEAAVNFGRVWPEIKPPIQELAVPEDKSKA